MTYELIIGQPRNVVNRLNQEKDFIPFFTEFIDDADKLLVIGQNRTDVSPVWPLSYDLLSDVDPAIALDDSYDWENGAKTFASGLYLTVKGAKGLVVREKIDSPQEGDYDSNVSLGEIHVAESGLTTISGLEDWPQQDSPVWITAMYSTNPADEEDYNKSEYFKFDNMADAVENFSYYVATDTEDDGNGGEVVRGSWGVNISTRGFSGGPSGFGTFPLDVNITAYEREGYVDLETGEQYGPNGGYGNFDIKVIQGPFRELRSSLLALEGDDVRIYGIKVIRQNKLQFYVLKIGTPNDEPYGDS